MHQSIHIQLAESLVDNALKASDLEAVCALLLMLSDSKLSPALQHRLAEYLIGVVTIPWLKQATLREGCVALNALQAYSPDLPEGDRLAVLLQKLISCEQQPGGPYGKPNADVSTNIAVAVFGVWAAGKLPLVEDYIKKHINNGTYVPSGMDMLYLARLGLRDIPIDEAKTFLAQYPLADTKPSVAAHAKIVTYIYVTSKWQANALRLPRDTLRSHIDEAMRLELSQNAAPFKKQGQQLYERVLAADTNFEISLLPYFFQQSMRQPTGSSQLILQLGIANIYTWLAYMTYDAILDDYSDRQLLNFANVAQRQALWHYQSATKDYFEMVRQAFYIVDHANAWEMQEARCIVRGDTIHIGNIPSYTTCSQLANRSIAHACGPLYLAYLSAKGQRHQLVTAAFRHYIIAKQLNDDMHDWQRDLKSGCLTYVVSRLLQALHIRPGVYSIHILLQQMSDILWRDQGQYIAQHVQHHVTQARHFFTASGYITDNNAIVDMLANLENIAHQAQVVRTQGAVFIQQLEDTSILH